MSRIESDFLGELEIPDNCWYGVQTMRAKQNFHILEIPMSQEPLFVKAFAYVKKASAMANKDLGTIPPEVADALIWACDELIAGKYLNQFVTDWIQGGAGTSTNMNVNEVICNLAAEKLGSHKGDNRLVSPNDHANFGQSTNDAYPTSLHIALVLRLETLIESLDELINAFYVKADRFRRVLKMGRTHLQDAVPMSLGQEFHGWGFTLEAEKAFLRQAEEKLKVINLGATAIGTTVTCHPEFPQKSVRILSRLTGIDLKNSEDLISATSDCGAYVALSSALKSLAVKLTKVCNDLRMLSSGPKCGLNEITLPSVQPGSFILPGKRNPVIPEVVNQAGFFAIGMDTTVTLAASAGQLELNVMEPVITFALFTSLKVMKNAIDVLRTKCIEGIEANPEHTEEMVMNSCGIVTLLKPHLGYKVCSKVAHECYESGKSLHQVVVEERKLLSQEEWDRCFSFDNLISPKFVQ